MGPALAIAAGFADRFVPEAAWAGLEAHLAATGDVGAIAAAAAPPPDALPATDWTARAFAGADVAAIRAALAAGTAPAAAAAAAAIDAASPLALAVTLRLIRAARAAPGLAAALRRETAPPGPLADGDFLEGVRAQIIDKDRRPRWRHAGPAAVPEAEVAAALAPRPDDLDPGGGTSMRIGFIGLGRMGTADGAATWCASAGHAVTGFDIDRASAGARTQGGARDRRRR